MAELGVPFEDTEFIPLLPEGARWGDIKDIDSDVEEQEPAAAAADGEHEFETDPKRLTARQQQVDFGKNTLGYERYLQAVPKQKRKLRGKDHDPPTPDVTQKMSKRSWDGIVKAWRRHLHKFDTVDTPNPAAAAAAGAGDGAAGAADMQVAAPPAVPDARPAVPNGKQWRSSGIKRRGSKQQSSSSNQRVRQDDTAGQQRQEQQRMPAPEKNSLPQLQTTTAQRQQQTDECSRHHISHETRSGSRREESSSGRHGSGRGGTEPRRSYDSNSNITRRVNPSSRHSYQRTAAAAEYSGVDGEHDREYGQPPRYSSSSATRSSRERGHGSGSGSRDHRGGSRSHQQPRDASGVAAAAAAAETGRRTPDTTAAGSGSRQLTPAKRGSSSQGDVDKRPPKHC